MYYRAVFEIEKEIPDKCAYRSKRKPRLKLLIQCRVSGLFES
jgi:hypothetical protein